MRLRPQRTQPTAAVVEEIMAIADGALGEEALADWIRQHSSKRR